MQNQQYAVASRLFATAFEYRALSPDDFFYFMALIYENQEKPDSALAYNLAVEAEPNSRRYRSLLLQRQKLYKSLGWEKEYGETLDSINFLQKQPSVWKTAVPRVSLSLSLGSNYWQEQLAAAPTLDGLRYSTMAKIGPYPGYQAKTRILWRIPLQSSRLRFGIEGFAGKSYRFNPSVGSPHFIDTMLGGLDKSLRGLFAWDNIFGVLTAQSDVRIRKTFIGLPTTSVSLALSATATSGVWTRFAEGAVTHTVNSSDYSAWLLASVDRTLIARHGPQMSLFLFFNRDDDLVIEHPGLPLLSDIDLSLAAMERIYTDSIVNTLFVRQPQRFLLFEPRIGYRFKASSWMAMGVSFGWNCTYYLGLTEWSIINMPLDAITGDSPTIPTFISRYKRCIENTPEITAGLEFPLKIGSILFDASLTKTLSTLKSDLPFDTDDRSVLVRLQWQKYLN